MKLALLLSDFAMKCACQFQEGILQYRYRDELNEGRDKRRNRILFGRKQISIWRFPMRPCIMRGAFSKAISVSGGVRGLLSGIILHSARKSYFKSGFAS